MTRQSTFKGCLRILLAATMGVFLFQGGARANSPHFISASDALSTTDPGDLVVSWKEAGLGDTPVPYTASADGTATYACINGGGNHPSASNKETVNGPVTASGTFGPTTNGQVTASLTVEEPSPGSFSCPGGQTFVLASVSYANVSITDTFNDVTESNLGDVSKTFCDLNTLTKATVSNCAPAP